MARVLAYTSPARGHLFPITPILIELRRRGHEIALRTLASQVPLMRSLGFDTRPIGRHIEAIEFDDWRAPNPRAALRRGVQRFVERSEFDGVDLQRAIEDMRPDAVLIDVNCWGALACAEAWGGPYAMFCPYPMPLRSADTPPFGPGLRPARGPLGHLRDSLLRPVVLGTIERAMLPALNQVRRRVGAKPLARFDDLFRRPPLVLYMTAEPFEYPRRDWPGSVVMVGACAWDPPYDLPRWLEEIAGPVVLVTTSSEFQGDGRLVEAALQGLAEEPFMVVATLPAGDPPNYRAPANARLERFVPHGMVLDRAVCAVTHGGMGATQKALARGVPVCVVPFGRDQLEVARRVEVACAGTRLPANRLNPERLRKKVREAINQDAGAKRVAEGFRAAGGPPFAAAAIETRLLAAKSSGRPVLP